MNAILNMKLSNKKPSECTEEEICQRVMSQIRYTAESDSLLVPGFLFSQAVGSVAHSLSAGPGTLYPTMQVQFGNMPSFTVARAAINVAEFCRHFFVLCRKGIFDGPLLPFEQLVQQAIEKKDWEMKNVLIHLGPGVNTIAENGLCPLRRAIISGNVELVEAVLEARANIEPPLERRLVSQPASRYTPIYGPRPVEWATDRSPLAHAIVNGHAHLLDILLTRIKFNTAYYRQEDFLCLALQKKQFAVFDRLIDWGMPWRTKEGNTTLHMLMCYDTTSDWQRRAQAALDAGCLVDSRGKNQQTALHEAVKAGSVQKTTWLLRQGADVHAICDYGSVPYQSSKKGAAYKIYKGVSALHMACDRAEAGLVKLLLDYKAMAAMPDARGSQPIHYVVNSTRGKANEEHQKNQIAVIMQLRDAGVAIDAQDPGERNQGPLHVAIERQSLHLSLQLIEWGASVEQRDAQDNTPLHGAVNWFSPCQLQVEAMTYGEEDHGLAVMQSLLDRGADVNAKNRWGETPLHLAARAACGRRIEVLRKQGADVGVKNHQGKTPLDCAKDSPLSKKEVQPALRKTKKRLPGAIVKEWLIRSR